MNDAPLIPGLLSTDTLPLSEEAALESAGQSRATRPPPAAVPGYRIERRLGDGAYGSVWLAQEQNTGKRVAIKFYLHRRGLDWSLLNREVEKLATLYTSRDVIGLLRVGWDSDPPYYVMEYLENGSLARLLEQGPLPAAEALRVMTSVAAALQHAHEYGILHCDLKPANVLMDGDFSPRLADFGQSRLSHEQNPALGTLFYMAPEQADLNANPSPAWDVYGFGALFYEVLVGGPPHRNQFHETQIHAAKTLEERLKVYRQVLAADGQPIRHRDVPGVDSGLASVIDSCLALDPKKRLPDARAIVDALDTYARRKSRRGIKLLTVVAPSLMLLAMIPVATSATNSAVRTAERNLADRGLESDLLTAKILAYALASDLEARMLQLLRGSRDPALLALLEQPTGRDTEEYKTALDAALIRLRDDARKSQSSQVNRLHETWFLTDSMGTQLWRYPPSTETLGKNFAYRDYFHGRGEDLPADTPAGSIPPATSPRISTAYRSKGDTGYKVAITVPIRSASGDRVVGIVARSVQLGDLLNEFTDLLDTSRTDGIDRILTLVDSRNGQVIDHPWMTPQRLSTLDEAEVVSLRVGVADRMHMQELHQSLVSQQNFAVVKTETDYIDPISRMTDATAAQYTGDWMAAFWPVRDTSWIAVVQERRDSALRPVREIRDGLLRYAVWGGALGIAVIVTLWTLVVRFAVDRRQRRRRTRGGPAGSSIKPVLANVDSSLSTPGSPPAH